MCQYCEKDVNAKLGQNQPILPYSSNILVREKIETKLYGYGPNQTGTPIISIDIKNFPIEDASIYIHIPIKFCPECGRKIKD